MVLFVCSYVGHKCSICYSFRYSLLYNTHTLSIRNISLSHDSNQMAGICDLVAGNPSHSIYKKKKTPGNHVTGPSEEERCHLFSCSGFPIKRKVAILVTAFPAHQ